MYLNPAITQQPNQLGNKSPDQLQDMWNQGMVSNVLQQNPGLRRVFSEENFKVHTPTSERLGDPIHQGRFSEFYPKGEEGGGDMLPNAWNLNNYNLELYHPDALNNPFIRQALTKGEMLHGMSDDPAWSGLKHQFMGQFNPDITNHYADMPSDQFSRQIGDAFLRASFFDNPNSTAGLHPPAYSPSGDYWNNNEWLSGYSPQQLQTVNQMKDLLQTGAVHYIPEDY
jgi:hypothetical protein